MNLLPSLFSLAAISAAAVSVFDHSWAVPDASDWKIGQDNGRPVLQLLVGKEPPASGPRRPFQFAIADTPEFTRVRVDADMKPIGRSLMIVFAYRDSDHFDYAHLSRDTAKIQSHHNGIFHVYGGERVRISSEDGPAAFPDGSRWYHVSLDWNGDTGAVTVAVNGNPVPALKAVDLSLSSGKVGIGSFDETGEFKNVSISGPH
ncbi:MAG: hypothetical protein JO061_10745 [Acidobacteriaceae bacterium]|nr:hypothetical protein [Acidobacteriaceae bacterium]